MARAAVEKWSKNWARVRDILDEKGPLRSDELKNEMSEYVSEATFKRMTIEVKKSKIKGVLRVPYKKAIYYCRPNQAGPLVERIIRDWEGKQRDIRLQIRGLEKHTKEVRDFLKGWIQQIPEVSLDYQCKKGYLPLPPSSVHIDTDGCGSPERYCEEELDLEKEPHFTSCIGKHGEIGRQLMEKWQEFKMGMKEFAEQKRELMDRIKVLVEKKLRLPFHPKANFPNDGKPCFTWHYLLQMYRYRLLLIGEGETWLRQADLKERLTNHICYNKQLGLYAYQPYGIWALLPPDGGNGKKVLKKQEKLREEMIGDLMAEELEERTKSIRKKKEDLDELRKDLIDRLKRMSSLPLLPETCSLMRTK
jgi:hypothetical protein